MHAVCPTRQAIDNQLNRDLIARARDQGFVFSDPFADAAIWQSLEAADMQSDPQLCQLCGHGMADWLLVKAFEATLFLIYRYEKIPYNFA